MKKTAAVFALLLCLIGVAAFAGGSDLVLRYPAAERIVAIGDLHGDLEVTQRVLRLAGAIDENDRWIGGDLVVVQTGDQLDRGDDERAILDLFARLRDEAEAVQRGVYAVEMPTLSLAHM